MNEQQQALFFRQLGATLKSGLGLGQGIRLSSQGGNQRERQRWQQVSWQLEQGQDLQTALQPIQKQFSRWAIAVVGMAERSGALAMVCGDLATTLEEMAERRRLFRGMALRMLRMVWSWGMVLYMALGGTVTTVQFWLVGCLVALILVLLIYAMVNWKPLGDRLRFVPPFRKLLTTQTFIHLGYLQLPLECGISIGEAVDWLRQDFPDPALQKILRQVEPKIRRGTSLTVAMQPHFPLMIGQIIQTGETAGTLPLSFEQIRQYYQRELRRAIQLLNLQVLFVSLLSFGFFVLLVGVQMLNLAVENLPSS